MESPENIPVIKRRDPLKAMGVIVVAPQLVAGAASAATKTTKSAKATTTKPKTTVKAATATTAPSAGASAKKSDVKVRLGFIALTDCAPIVMAKELGRIRRSRTSTYLFVRRTTVTDPRGGAWVYDFDWWYRQVRLTPPGADQLGFGTFYERDVLGQTLKVTDPAGRKTTFVYDPAGRMIETAKRNPADTVLELLLL